MQVKEALKDQAEDLEKKVFKVNDRLVSVNLSQAESEEKMTKVLETVIRVEDTIIAMKRGNASTNLKAKLM